MNKSNLASKEEIFVWIKVLQEEPNNEKVRENIVLAYENLVHSLAHRYSRNQEHHADLFQVGIIGLLLAAERFDTSFERPFESYAVPTILGEIKRYIRDKTWDVHVPRRIKELGPKINKAIEVLTEENQCSPQISEIAQYLEVSEEDVIETMEMSSSYSALSADMPRDADAEGGTVSILDLVGNKDAGFEAVDTRMLLDRVLPVLPEREQEILTHLFFDNLSQQETADRMDLSQMHVSRLQRKALKTLREELEGAGVYRF